MSLQCLSVCLSVARKLNRIKTLNLHILYVLYDIWYVFIFSQIENRIKILI